MPSATLIALRKESRSLTKQLARVNNAIAALEGKPVVNRTSKQVALKGQEPATGTISAKMLTAIRNSPDGLHVNQIAAAVDRNISQVSGMIKHIKDRGFIRRVAVGKYQAV